MSVLGAGFYGPTEGERRRRIEAATKRMNQVIDDLPIPEAEKQSDQTSTTTVTVPSTIAALDARAAQAKGCWS